MTHKKDTSEHIYWRRWYILVLVVLGILILFFTWFTNYFS